MSASNLLAAQIEFTVINLMKSYSRVEFGIVAEKLKFMHLRGKIVLNSDNNEDIERFIERIILEKKVKNFMIFD